MPLKKGSRIALVGPFADSRWDLIGSWVHFAEAGRTSTFLDGLRARFGADRVTYARGCDPHKALEGGISEAVAAAAKSDVVLVALGLKAGESGEAASLASLALPDAQRDLLESLKQTGKPVVVLLVTGRPMELAREAELADALLLTWYPGTMAGEALADVVSGDYNPSGRLPMTFPRTVGQIPIHYDKKSTGRPADESGKPNKYTSRYLDVPNSPQYCFGYGLSYTTFGYSDLRVLTPETAVGGEVRVSVRVTNTGGRDGEEVVRLCEQIQPDAVLMDVRMPVMGGLEATRQIRKMSPDVPIIAMSAYSYGNEPELAREAGCNDFLTKPLSQYSLNKILNAALVDLKRK